MKLTAFDAYYSQRLVQGGNTLGVASGSNFASGDSSAGGDVIGQPGDYTVVGLRQTVALASNIGGTTVGDVLTIIQTSPRLAKFATPSNSGVSFGSNATHVAEVSSAGAGSEAARTDHYHAGVAQITSSSSNTLQRGTVNFRAGANVGLTASDTDGDGEFDTVTIHATGTGGGGGSGTRAFGLDRVTLDSTYGDEFTGASLNAKWTRHNQTSGQETYQAGGLGSALRVAHGTSNAAEYIYQAAPNGTNETWEASVTWFQENTSLQMFGIIMVSSTGTGVAAHLYDNVNGLYLSNVSSHTYSSALTSITGLKATPSYYQSGGRVWLRLRKASGVYSASYSFDGQDWSREATGTPSAFTPARIGIGRFLGTTSQSFGIWHWFDKTA